MCFHDVIATALYIYPCVRALCKLGWVIGVSVSVCLSVSQWISNWLWFWATISDPL